MKCLRCTVTFILYSSILLYINVGAYIPSWNRPFRPRTLHTSAAEPETWDDETLLKEVSKDQLIELCQSLNLKAKGTKEELLMQLRTYAKEQAELEKNRILSRNQRVEEGTGDGREKYEVVGEDDEDEDDDELGAFYFNLPAGAEAKETTGQAKKKSSSKPAYLTPTAVTAPPPPKEANEKGERVVQVYSTKDQNDLTGIAAAQPGQAGTSTDSLLSSAEATTEQPWDAKAVLSKTSEKDIEVAKGRIIELVSTLLAMSGAPAFVDTFDEDLLEKFPTFNFPSKFIGFNPRDVPTSLLSEYSQSLRTGRGQVLDEVLRQFEIQGIGQDGMHGDNVENGGGHYREVTKVRAFLDGFRRAEVRRLARDTTALLLDKLVLEGVEGLDITLATMARGNDDTANEIGELNDSLLAFLNDAIRSYEKKVGPQSLETPQLASSEDEEDSISQLWNVTLEDGQRVESLDPSDPKVKLALQQQMQKESWEMKEQLPDSPQARILLLLKLLRERVKAEAAFGNDEKGRNLRLLAYCLRVDTNRDREELMKRDLGSSVDRLDSFIELVSSSIEYGESTSYQLGPAKNKPLNLPRLRQILAFAKDARERRGSSTFSP